MPFLGFNFHFPQFGSRWERGLFPYKSSQTPKAFAGLKPSQKNPTDPPQEAGWVSPGTFRAAHQEISPFYSPQLLLAMASQLENQHKDEERELALLRLLPARLAAFLGTH